MLLQFFVLSLITLLIGVIFILKRKNRGQGILSSYQLMMVFIFVAAIWFFVPFYFSFFQADLLSEKVFNTFFLSIYRAICLFVVGADYNELYHYAIAQGKIGIAYSLYGSILYLISPIMTFGFVLSFFENITVRMRIFLGRKKDIYIFSEINESTIYLANDICKECPKNLILFSSLHYQASESDTSLERNIKSIGALSIQKDIVAIAELFSRPNLVVNCIIMGENEERNVEQTLLLLQMKHNYRLNIYVCSNKDNYLFEDIKLENNTALFCKNSARTIVLQALQKNGEKFFLNASEEECGEKNIGAMVLGMGTYGSEMVKALSWYTQAEGYNTQIYCFDKDPYTEECFVHTCPGYFENDFNPQWCSIQIYSGIVCGTRSFDIAISKLKDISYVFIALGNDELNISTAYDVRTLFARYGNYPVIHALVRNDNKRKLLEGRKTRDNQEYNITYIGSLHDVYSYETVFSLKQKQDILGAYYSNPQIPRPEGVPREIPSELSSSSLYEQIETSILHRRVTGKLEMKVIDHAKSQHRSWVNYMFGNGYLYNDKDDNRDDIAKWIPHIHVYEKWWKEIPDEK